MVRLILFSPLTVMLASELPHGHLSLKVFAEREKTPTVLSTFEPHSGQKYENVVCLESIIIDTPDAGF